MSPEVATVLPGERAYEELCAGTNAGAMSGVVANENPCVYQPGGNCGTNSCIEWNLSGMRGEYRCCQGTSKAAERRCVTQAAQTPCGYAGSNGCALCWSESFDELCGTYPDAESGEAAICFLGTIW